MVAIVGAKYMWRTSYTFMRSHWETIHCIYIYFKLEYVLIKHEMPHPMHCQTIWETLTKWLTKHNIGPTDGTDGTGGRTRVTRYATTTIVVGHKHNNVYVSLVPSSRTSQLRPQPAIPDKRNKHSRISIYLIYDNRLVIHRRNIISPPTLA